MNTSDIEILKNSIKDADFKAGNVRSLAMSLSSKLGSAPAWEFARSIANTFGKDFTRKNVIDTVDSMELTPKKKTTAKVGGTKQPQIESKNSKIRKLLEAGKTVSEISVMLDLTYQRVKNVQKEMNKKAVEA